MRENATQYAIHHDKQLDKQNEAAETILMNEVTGRPGMSCMSVRSPPSPAPSHKGSTRRQLERMNGAGAWFWSNGDGGVGTDTGKLYIV